MFNVILTPYIKAQRHKMRRELFLLKLKKKIFGKLSEADEKRWQEIMLEFAKRY